MCARLDGSPVIARCNRDGVDAVHDAFVMGCRTMRVCARYFAGEHDVIANQISGNIAASKIVGPISNPC